MSSTSTTDPPDLWAGGQAFSLRGHLLHEHGREDPQQVGPSATVAALPGIIDDYLAAGYTFVQMGGTPFPTTAHGETAVGRRDLAGAAGHRRHRPWMSA